MAFDVGLEYVVLHFKNNIFSPHNAKIGKSFSC